MYRLACGLAAAVLAAPAAASSPDPAALAIPPEQTARARELVRQLGSDAYPDRAKAARELEQMGRAALPALLAARDDADPEVRMRTGMLLPRAEAADLRARVETFLADADGKYDHDLPGWTPFRLVVGDDPPARDLFGGIVRNPANHELLLAMRGQPAAATGLAGGAVTPLDRPATRPLAAALVTRRQALFFAATPPVPVGGPGAVVVRAGRPALQTALPDVALVLLAESVVSERDAPVQRFQFMVATFLFTATRPEAEGVLPPDTRDAVAGRGRYAAAFRRLVLHWLDTRDGTIGLDNAQRLASALRLGDPVVAKYAAKMLRVPGTPLATKARLLGTVAKYGGRAALPELTAMFGETKAPFGGGVIASGEPEVLLQDVALVMAVLVTGQDPAEYGFEVLSPQASLKFAETNYQLQLDENGEMTATRAKAFAKWRAWETAQHAAAAGSAVAHLAVARKYPGAKAETKKKD